MIGVGVRRCRMDEGAIERARVRFELAQAAAQDRYRCADRVGTVEAWESALAAYRVMLLAAADVYDMVGDLAGGARLRGLARLPYSDFYEFGVIFDADCEFAYDADETSVG